MENVKLALEINRMIHNECKDVPHDIGARIMELIEKDYDVKLILPAVDITFKEKQTQKFEDFLNKNFIEVDGFYQSLKTGYLWPIESVLDFYAKAPKVKP